MTEPKSNVATVTIVILGDYTTLSARLHRNGTKPLVTVCRPAIGYSEILRIDYANFLALFQDKSSAEPEQNRLSVAHALIDSSKFTLNG
jgi:hypothetical protein